MKTLRTYSLILQISTEKTLLKGWKTEIKISKPPITSKVDEKPWKTHLKTNSKYIQLTEPYQKGLKTSRTKMKRAVNQKTFTSRQQFCFTMILKKKKNRTALFYRCFIRYHLRYSISDRERIHLSYWKLCRMCCKKKGTKVWKIMFIQLLYKYGMRKGDIVWGTEIKRQNILKTFFFFLF